MRRFRFTHDEQFDRELCELGKLAPPVANLQDAVNAAKWQLERRPDGGRRDCQLFPDIQRISVNVVCRGGRLDVFYKVVNDNVTMLSIVLVPEARKL